jgi:hypothetical protein
MQELKEHTKYGSESSQVEEFRELKELNKQK